MSLTRLAMFTALALAVGACHDGGPGPLVDGGSIQNTHLDSGPPEPGQKYDGGPPQDAPRLDSGYIGNPGVDAGL